jgi:hypothetical protein
MSKMNLVHTFPVYFFKIRFNTILRCMPTPSTFMHRWLYSSSYLLFFSFLTPYTVSWAPWTGDQPLHREQNRHRHPCLEWDSNPRPQRSKTVHAAIVIGSRSSSLSLRFGIKTFRERPSHACYKNFPSHSNDVYITRLLILLLSATSYVFIPLRSKYCPSAPPVYVPSFM